MTSERFHIWMLGALVTILALSGDVSAQNPQSGEAAEATYTRRASPGEVTFDVRAGTEAMALTADAAAAT